MSETAPGRKRAPRARAAAAPARAARPKATNVAEPAAETPKIEAPAPAEAPAKPPARARAKPAAASAAKPKRSAAAKAAPAPKAAAPEPVAEAPKPKPAAAKPAAAPKPPAPEPETPNAAEAAATGKKPLSLALQGGGSHGAFAWGVLDRIFEADVFDVRAIVGTSAGAMNASVAAYGLAKGGPTGAREALSAFWGRISNSARMSPLQPSPLDRMMGLGNVDFSPAFAAFELMSRFASPYQLNPMNVNPLRDVLAASIDFDWMHEETAVKLFICASNVMTGKIRVFTQKDLSIEAVLASACLPFMFQAVEIDGEHYWDGGYMGNPPLYPLIYHAECADILLVQLNPIVIDELPTTAQQILDRINTLSFNSSLMREMRVISFVSKLIDKGFDDGGRLKRMFIHTVDGQEALKGFGVSSKLNADKAFLTHLFEQGRKEGERFLAEHLDDVGVRSSTDIDAKFL